MRDPRLMEIDFLTSVEREGTRTIQLSPGAPDGYFGADERTCRRMLAQLVIEGHITAPSMTGPDTSFDPAVALKRIDTAKGFTIVDALRGAKVEVAISHAGRIRLVTLREDLDRSRIRDPFGLLFDQRYRLRDLFVCLLDASPDSPLSVLACDVDHFKQVNEKFGHDEGDAVLKRVFQIALDVVGERGDSYRRGGDEFVIYMPGTPLADAQAVAEKIRSSVEVELRDRLDGVSPTLSVGVTSVTARVAPEEVSEFTDALQIQAKNEGKNRVVSKQFSPSD